MSIVTLDQLLDEAPTPSLDIRPPRAWMLRAVAKYWQLNQENFLCSSTPGSGKTRFGLEVARELLRTTKEVEQIVVVVHTQSLRPQWRQAALELGIDLDSALENTNKLSPDYDGYVTTYQQVAANPSKQRERLQRPSLVIFDEPHHMGDKEAWAVAARTAFQNARRRLLLTGTPFRSDEQAIPFVNYVDKECVSDFQYSYGEALRDGVCRYVAFPSYEGTMSWFDPRRGEVVRSFADAATVDELKWCLNAALRTDQEWLPRVLKDADAELEKIRVDYQYPQAGGLVIAQNQAHAQQIADLIRKVTGSTAAVAISDDPDSAEIIRRFSGGTTRWLVAVKMVSEGVDIPRLCVGVYATNVLTELFFRQAVGRFVRLEEKSPDFISKIYIPAEPTLQSYVARLEDEVNQVVQAIEDDQEQENQGASDGLGRQISFFPIVVTGAQAILGDVLTPDQAAYSPAEIAMAEGVLQRSGVRGVDVLKVAQITRTLVAELISDTPSAPSVRVTDPGSLTKTQSKFERKVRVKANRNKLVNMLAALTEYTQQQIWLMVATATGANQSESTLEQLQQGEELLQKWVTEAVKRQQSEPED